ncbi:MAG: metallophosphoesterase [Verrucomicrobia bacterium]|nr:metallophosphoesterase [Verrucomicrobiota bacterium]MCH8514382.1 metallophosphoesterase [Kiritimatiellia bacterium]
MTHPNPTSISDGTKVMLLGDVHRQFEDVTRLIEAQRPSLILQVGDLGYWPKKERRILRDGTVLGGTLDTLGIPLHFCDGNHEDHAALRALEALEVFPNVFYQPRGSLLTLPDGRKVLFAGGARSIDREYRVVGEDWFAEEVLREHELEGFPDTEVDIVVSHTAPREFDPLDLCHRDRDPSRICLSWVLHRMRPKLWVFGHFHRQACGEWHGVKWISLGMAGQPQWWQWLPGRET